MVVCHKKIQGMWEGMPVYATILLQCCMPWRGFSRAWEKATVLQRKHTRQQASFCAVPSRTNSLLLSGTSTDPHCLYHLWKPCYSLATSGMPILYERATFQRSWDQPCKLPCVTRRKLILADFYGAWKHRNIAVLSTFSQNSCWTLEGLLPSKHV